MITSFTMKNLEDRDLAKDFGFDVTVPNGGIMSSAATNRLYKTECRRIYNEFLLNMRDYLFHEERIKQELHKVHGYSEIPVTSGDQHERINSTDSSTYSHRAINKSPEQPVSKAHSTYGFIRIGKQRRSSVSTCFTQRNESTDTPNPDLVYPEKSKRYDCDIQTKQNKTEIHDALVESNSTSVDRRMVTMNTRAFSRLVSGKAKIRVLNKDSGYVLHPLPESKMNILMSKDAVATNMSEKLAVLRERTNFKSPTLSHDLKVNNLVAIKKSLLGDNSMPRLSVSDVMTSARERRSRLFRIHLTNDNIEDKSPNVDNKYPKRKNQFLRMKAPSSKLSSPRLTRMNLARIEMDLQKEAIEKMRNTVTMMANSLDTTRSEHQNENPKCGSDITLRKVETHSTSKPNQLASPRLKFEQCISRSSEIQTKGKLLTHREKTKDNHFNPSEKPQINGTTLLRFAENPRRKSEVVIRPGTIHSGFRSLGSSPRRVTHHDIVTMVRRSEDDDRERDVQMNLWRQRMTFAVGKN